MTEQSSGQLVVRRGVCHAVYVGDLGLSVDLDRCKRLLARAQPCSEPTPNRRAPQYFGYTPPPLRIRQPADPIEVGGGSLSDSADVVIYDFGAVSVTYQIGFQGPLDSIAALSFELSRSDRLAADARRRIEDLLAAIRPAVSRPRLGALMEDYLVFQVLDAQLPCPLNQVPEVFGQSIARILRVEPGALSEQEVADAVSVRIAYGPEDLTLVDWNAALLFDRDAEDVLAVLEFANIELLELRGLDAQLDDSLDRSYEMLSAWNWQRLFGISRTSSLRRVGQMQVDGAILFERVSNALKLLGDQYLARLYRMTSQRFHLAEWNAAALRKLDAIESLYEKLSDRNANRRLEILEWIIILLIAFEIVWPFVSKRWGP